LRTEEPEPESDSCIIRSRLLGALPKRRLRLASRLPSPRRDLQASGTPTCSALEPESDGASLVEAPTLSDRPGSGPACAGDPRDKSRPGPASAGDPETPAGLASAESQAPCGSPRSAPTRPASDGRQVAQPERPLLGAVQTQARCARLRSTRVAASTSGLFGDPSELRLQRPLATPGRAVRDGPDLFGGCPGINSGPRRPRAAESRSAFWSLRTRCGARLSAGLP